MISMLYEVALAVEDFNDDFDACADATDCAVETTKAEIAEVVGDRISEITFGHAEFLEFDSGNPGHASGYFNVQIFAPEDLYEKITSDL